MVKEAQHTPTSRSSSPKSDFQGIFAGNTKLHPRLGACSGHLVDLYGEQWYRISNFDQLNPFLITLSSVGDHWLFISSTGALTAGRRNADHALFPYMTDDQLHNATSYSGSLTIVRIERHNQTLLWEPFSPRQEGIYRIERKIYKNTVGNKLLFEEFNRDLNLKFSYSWQCVHQFGFVRRSRLESTWRHPMRIIVLDGITNILPSGVSAEIQRSRSTLVDAYKVNELEKQIGVFSLSSLIVDHPVPEEALRSTLVWQHGPRLTSILLSLNQLDAFRRAKSLDTEHSILGQSGAYLVERNIRLSNDRAITWDLVADIDQDITDLSDLKVLMSDSSSLVKTLRRQEKDDTLNLQSLIAGADGLQKTANSIGDLRHFTNTLFNSMRGGIPLNGYTVDKQDLIDFVSARHHTLGSSDYFNPLPHRIDVTHLTPPENPQLHRLITEYLPLAYSRRHGDPSRPWNAFTINTHDSDGDVLFDYSGNWRDLFQNWEALGKSFPRFYPAMLSTFVNASTADGYNPYRIGRNGVDWEIPDESDPWASIGYWGDHQLIYLLCLLESTDAYNPDKLEQMMTLPIFSYVQVPYRLKAFEQILADPKHSVEFDWDLHERILERVATIGSDGRLLHSSHGEPLLVTLAEKLLVPALTKLCALVPGAGIWLNTQRPEWNDANNALAGWGCSLVTLYHLHKYLKFLRDHYRLSSIDRYSLSNEIAEWLKETHEVLSLRNNDQNSTDRYKMMYALGQSACNYRAHLYQNGLQKASSVPVSATFLEAFCTRASETIQSTLVDALTEDGLVHSYTMIHPRSDETVDVETLQLMLEGQVAALASDNLCTSEAIQLLSALRGSPLYSQLQGAYLLYADKTLPSFSQRNQMTTNDLVRLPVVRKLIHQGDLRLMKRSPSGQFHFNPDIVNRPVLEDTLDMLISEGTKISDRDRFRILALYEKTFNHSSFTGRSGRFFKYEGLGCVYWHMVSKLLLAVQGAFWKAIDTDAPERSWKTLARHYYEIRHSLGGSQTPAKYGAFPQDAYSHTPKWGGAHQPGLTGQVKEDIICRWGELGIRVKDGILSLHPALLQKNEFLQKNEDFTWVNIDKTLESIHLHKGQIAFTYCQVLFVYHLCDTPLLKLRGTISVERPELNLSRQESNEIFGRTGKITRVDAFLSPWN